MKTANDLIASFVLNREIPQQAISGHCQGLVSDAFPPVTRMMTVIREELCPSHLCNDVDRAIIGASLGG